MASTATRGKRGKTTKKKRNSSMSFPVIIEKDEGGFFASCPALQGCYTDGETYEEALANIQEAILLHVEDRLANHEPIPSGEAVSLTMVEVRL